MKLKILIGILVFLIVVNLATLGTYIYFRMQADDDRSPVVPRAYHSPGKFSSPPILRLEPEQRQQLLELRMSLDEDTREYSERIRKLRNDIFMAVKDDSVSMDEIEKKLEEIAELRMQIEKAAISNLLEARRQLSPAQRDHLFRFLLRDFDGRPPFQRKPGFFREKSELNKNNNQKQGVVK